MKLKMQIKWVLQVKSLAMKNLPNPIWRQIPKLKNFAVPSVNDNLFYILMKAKQNGLDVF